METTHPAPITGFSTTAGSEAPERAAGAAPPPRSLEPLSKSRRRREDAYRRKLSAGILLSVAAHFLLFQAAPAFRAAAPGAVGGDLEAVELPPEVKVPPPPEQIARPATPTVAEATVDEEVTIAPTTFEANPVEQLPPPPKAGTTRPEDRPVFIPRDVDPVLTNRDEIANVLRRAYPDGLRQAGIGGVVVLWVFVDENGQVSRAVVKEPSRYGSFDKAAFAVAERMEFKPAINRDRPIGVWVSQKFNFSVTD